MSFKIDEFRSSMRYGGLRANLFDVVVTNPTISFADGVLPFRCKAASEPESTLNTKNLFYKGRPIKLPGARTYESWDTTIIEDEDYVVREALETWNSYINSHEGNNNRLPTTETTLYKSIGDVKMYDQNNNLLRTIQLVGIWPATIGKIMRTWDGDEIVTYDVRWEYDYWRPVVGGSNIQV